MLELTKMEVLTLKVLWILNHQKELNTLFLLII